MFAPRPRSLQALLARADRRDDPSKIRREGVVVRGRRSLVGGVNDTAPRRPGELSRAADDDEDNRVVKPEPLELTCPEVLQEQ